MMPQALESLPPTGEDALRFGFWFLLGSFSAVVGAWEANWQLEEHYLHTPSLQIKKKADKPYKNKNIVFDDCAKLQLSLECSDSVYNDIY